MVKHVHPIDYFEKNRQHILILLFSISEQKINQNTEHKEGGYLE